MNLLNFCFCIFLDILRSSASLNALLQLLNCITASVTNTDFSSFRFLLRLFSQQTTTFFRQRRNTQTNHFTIVFRSDTDFGIHDPFFNILDNLLLPRSNHDRSRIRNSYGSHICQRNRSTVIHYSHAIQDFRIRLTGTNMRQLFIQIFDRKGHLLFCRLYILFYICHKWLYIFVFFVC